MKKYALISLFLALITGCGSSEDDKKPTAKFIYPSSVNELSNANFAIEEPSAPTGGDVSIEWNITSNNADALSYEINGNILDLQVGDVTTDMRLTVSATLTSADGHTNTYSEVYVIINDKSQHGTHSPAVTDAKVTISAFFGKNVVLETTTNESGKWVTNNSYYDDDKLYLIQISDGYSDDGQTNNGMLRTVVKGSEIKNKKVLTSLYTDVIYRTFNEISHRMDSAEIESLINANELALFHFDAAAANPNLNVRTTKTSSDFNNSLLIESIQDLKKTDNDELSIIEVYLAGNENSIEQAVSDKFGQFFRFNNLYSANVKNKNLRLSVLGDAKITSASGAITMDSTDAAQANTQNFIIPASTNSVTLNFTELNGYEFDSWVGCREFTVNNGCIADTFEDTKVELLLKRPLVYKRDTHNLSDYAENELLDINNSLFFFVDENDQDNVDFFEKIKVGDFIYSQNGQGFLREVTAVSIKPDGYTYATEIREISDVIESGTYIQSYTITNEDIEREAARVAQRAPNYTPNAIVPLNKEKTVYAKLASDKTSSIITLYRAKNSTDDKSAFDSNTNVNTYSLAGTIIDADYGKYSVSLSAPTELIIYTTSYLDVGLGNIHVRYVKNLKANVNPNFKFAYTADGDKVDGNINLPLFDITIARIPFLLGTIGISLDASAAAGYAIEASGGGEFTSQANIEAGFDYDSNKETNSFTVINSLNGNLVDNKFSASGLISTHAGINLNINSDYNTVKLPVFLYENNSILAEVKAHGAATNTPAKCTGTLIGNLFHSHNKGLGIGFSGGKFKIFGFDIKVPDGNIRFGSGPKKDLLISTPIAPEWQNIVGGIPEECHTPSIVVSGDAVHNIPFPTDYSVIKDYFVENNSEVLTYYTARDVTDLNYLKLTYKVGNDGGWKSLPSSEGEIPIEPGEIHTIRATVDVRSFFNGFGGAPYTAQFTIGHTKLPRYDADKQKAQKKTFNISVNAPDMDLLASPFNLESSYDQYKYSVLLSWDYDEKSFDKRYSRKFRITRTDANGKVVVLNDLNIKTRNIYDYLPNRGQYTYKIFVVSGEYETASSSTSVSLISPIVGTYIGQYSWDCGNWWYGEVDENGRPILGVNRGNGIGSITITSDNNGWVEGNLSVWSSDGFGTIRRLNGYSRASRDGRIIEFGSWVVRINSYGNISGTSYNGPECSHPTNYNAASFSFSR